MKYCSIDAFARCPLDERCKDFREASFMEGSECDAFNQAVLNRPRTNADRIRNMSDAELSMVIMCPDGMDDNSCSGDGACAACCLNWLQQPADIRKAVGNDEAAGRGCPCLCRK